MRYCSPCTDITKQWPKHPNAVSSHLQTRQEMARNVTVCPILLLNQTHLVASINASIGNGIRNKDMPQICLLRHECVMLLPTMPATYGIRTAICPDASKRGVSLCQKPPSGIQLSDTHELNQSRRHALRSITVHEFGTPPCLFVRLL